MAEPARFPIRLAASMLAATAAMPAPGPAHEIPSDVTVRMIVRPRDERLQVLVRVPLEAMQDIDFPTVGPGYLDVPKADTALRRAAMLWLANDLLVYEGDEPLGRPSLVAARASIPSDRSFSDIASALAHVRAPPLPAGTELVWQQALLDVLFELPVRSPDSTFAIEPRFARLGLRVATALQFVAADGTARVFELGADPGRVVLDPRWHQAFLSFLEQGFLHILDGTDHLLFLLCLVLPLRASFKALVLAVTAFTVAHSITLAASAFGAVPNGLWFPPLVETLIAASILYMAIENIVTDQPRLRFIVAFGFGLVHGFGFSFALRNTLQFAGDHVLTSLLSFNLGVELGQILVVLVLVLVLNAILRITAKPRIVVLIVSAFVAHTAWHWLGERYSVLRQYELPFAALESATTGARAAGRLDEVSAQATNGSEPPAGACAHRNSARHRNAQEECHVSNDKTMDDGRGTSDRRRWRAARRGASAAESLPRGGPVGHAARRA